MYKGALFLVFAVAGLASILIPMLLSGHEPSEEVQVKLEQPRTELLRRVRGYRTRAYVILFVIAGVILSGVDLFISAERMDDTTGMSEVKDHLARTRDEYKELRTLLNPRFIRVPTRAGPDDTPQYLMDSTIAAQQLNDVLSGVDTLETSVQQTQKLVEELFTAKEIELMRLSLYHVSLIRIGLIFLLFFTCQILIRLLRYYLQLADYYQAIIDAMKYAADWDLPLIEAFKLAHPNFHIGTTPKSPMERMQTYGQHVKSASDIAP